MGRKKTARTALLRSLVRSLVLHEGINTTVARAKELRPYVERLISQAKQNSVTSRRSISSTLGGSASTVKKLHETIAPRYATRVGGYVRITRIGRTGNRAAESARIEFVQEK